MEHNHPDIESVLVDERQIQETVERVGAEITRDYAGESIVLVCILNGAFIFASDLMRHIDLPCSIDFMSVSSYGNDTKSSGVVKVLQDLRQDVAGRHVVIVEDILDTGCTLSHVVEMLKGRGAASVEIATFAIKDLPDVERPVTARYIGVHVPNEFVVGYGLDYAERYRNLPYVGILKPEVYA